MRRWMALVVALTSCCGEAEQIDGDGAADAWSDFAEGDEAEATPACTDAERGVAEEEVRALALGAAPCFGGTIVIDEGRGVVVEFSAGYSSFEWGLSTCYVHPHSTSEASRMRGAVEDAVRPWVPPCPNLWVVVYGGVQDDVARMGAEIERTCGFIWDAYFVIEVDADGRASDVYGDSGAAELLTCIRTALTDDVFPCLATTQLCPEYWITE